MQPENKSLLTTSLAGRHLVVTHVGSLPWHFAQLFLVFPIFYLAFRMTVSWMTRRVERIFLVRGLYNADFG